MQWYLHNVHFSNNYISLLNHLPQRWSNTSNKSLQLACNIVALQVEKRCWAYYHPPQTLSRNKILLLQVEKICWKKVDACGSTCCNMLLQLATTKLFCMIIFEVGGNTCNNDSQLATQECCVEVEEKKLAAR